MKTKNALFIIPVLFGLLLAGCGNDNSGSEPTPPTIQDFSSAVFNDASYVYDGSAHQLSEVSGVPSGTSVTYEGRDSQINVGEYPATATLTKEGYNTKTLSATLSITPATFSNIVFASQSLEYNGSAHTLVCSNVPSFASVVYQNNVGTEVGTYNATATISAPNYNDLVLHATLTITKGNIKGITFNNASYTYDGSEHSVTISGTLPTGVSVNYQNNKRTDSGSQEATATISGEGYNTLVLHATLTINKAVFTGISFNDLTVNYDGNTHTITATGVPSFANVVYTNNSAMEGGVYNATATISAPNYETLVLHATLTINLKQITGITFNDQSFEYDGYQHNIAITGTLPVGSTIYYEGNGKVDVGVYTVTATMMCTGYETLVLTATMTITARIITGVSFENKDVDYDGSEHSILISGTLPSGVSVSYSNNTRTDIGIQTATATLSGTGYETLVLTAILCILDPHEDLLKCTSEQNILVSTSEYSSGSKSLTTKRGTSIEFAYHDAKGDESDNWLTLKSGGYFYNITPIESFEDLDLLFKDGYEQVRVYYSYNSPIFDNAHSKDYVVSKYALLSPSIIDEKQPVYFKVENIDENDITFERIDAYINTSLICPTLTLTVNDSSYGSVAGGGKYKLGSNVTISATPSSSSYVFDCWKKNDEIVSLKAEYTFSLNENISLEAVFVTKSQHEWDLAHGVRPTLDMTNKTATYGMYPKTHVNKQSLINILNNISEPEENGWYLYENEYYAKVIATPYVFSSGYIPEFDDGSEIIAGETYWFKVEAIQWRVLRKEYSDGGYYLLSEYLLDTKAFYSSKDDRTIDEKTIYANNYKYSDIRSWLNGDFYSKAFSLDNSCVYNVTVDNSKYTTNNSSGSYYCDNTKDYVFLPSYKEMSTYDYGWDNSDEHCRRAFTTDYSRAVGASYIAESMNDGEFVKFSAQYFMRSPDNTFYGNYYSVSVVKHGGFIGNMANESVIDSSTLLRPAISFNAI